MQTIRSEKLAQAEARWLEAHAAYEMGDFPRSAEAYRAASLLYEDLDAASYFDALLGLALSLDHLGQHRESLEHNRRVLEARSASAKQKADAQRNISYAEAVRCFSNAEFAAAQAQFTKALDLDAENGDFRSDILMWLAACHTQLGQFAAAGATYADLLATAGTHDVLRTEVSQRHTLAEANVLFAARRYNDARSKYEELLRRCDAADEMASGARLMLAHCCFQLSEYGQARRRYREILQARGASAEQKREAHQWYRAIPGWLQRLLRSFAKPAAAR